MRANWIQVLALFCLSVTAHASFKVDTYAGVTHQEPLESLYNPGNHVFYLANDFAFAEVRPDLRIDTFDFASLVFRPRARAVGQETIATTPASDHASTLDLWFNEEYVSLKPMADLEILAGRQIYQWGPAELLNPSNLFFPELLTRLEPFFEVRGRSMARVNWSLGSQWSWVTMAELNPLDDQNFETPTLQEDQSLNRLQTKLEFNWNNSANYIGVTAGRIDDPRGVENAAGAYAAYTLSDAFQMYTDFIVQDDNTATSTQQSAFYGIGGIRYTAPGGTELRVEAVRNGLGMTADELTQFRGLLASPLTQSAAVAGINTSRGALPGQNYLYAALRWSSPSTHLAIFQQPVVALRSLISTTDQSSFSMLSFESGLSQAWTAYLYGGISAGARDSELREVLGESIGLALRLSL